MLRWRSRQLRVFIRLPHKVDMHHRRVVGFDLSTNARRHSCAAKRLEAIQTWQRD